MTIVLINIEFIASYQIKIRCWFHSSEWVSGWSLEEECYNWPRLKLQSSDGSSCRANRYADVCRREEHEEFLETYLLCAYTCLIQNNLHRSGWN